MASYCCYRNQELSEKLTRDRYELARLALHQPHIDMETYIRAIRTEINQSVKLAVKEALDKHATSTSALQPPMQSPSTAHTSYNNNNNNNRTHEKNNTNVGILWAVRPNFTLVYN